MRHGTSFNGCATATEAIRRAIQNSQESLRGLAKRYGVSQKTVAKWKKRGTVADLPTGPKEAKSTVLSIEEEAIIVAFRRHTLLSLVQLVKKTGRSSASAFLEALIAAVPYKIHTVLTDNGIQFTFPPRHANGPTQDT